MKKRITEFVVILTLICIVYACIQHQGSAIQDKQKPSSAKANDQERLIVPGKSIGKISIGGSADSVVSLLGKPDFSDAAMGSALMTWYNKHDTSGYKISIFAAHNFGAKNEAVAHIRKILTTSPAFKTAEGLNPGMPLSEYSRHFKLTPAGGFTTNGGGKIKVYEAKEEGIAFEIDSVSNTGIAIVVHKPNDTSATYINMN
ncbi:hypothetical protein KXD93_27935 [Mucilaginibacter sp. BJC16-A38]|uniref:hypothetical protein n=1 Tax=Mucilaginibacter phenanthrenivorans TaxID=1234842 RepID=UPI0021589C68|nr:hypothetical protein [Mucilaginibacter phenanthrenivorans]MCR8561517.1 hypothetical protein [Mucilaginibacter phenanthrenivorans]